MRLRDLVTMLVSLSVCVPLLSCDKGGGDGRVAPLTERQEAVVYPVWFSGMPGTESAQGGTSKMTVRVDPNPSGEPAVAMLEQIPGAIGKMWLTAAWLGAFNASQALGLPIGSHEFLIRVSDYMNVDGPSAGMLMAVSMAALIRKDPLRPDSTMSGTINPDGSAGTVGGLPQKMQGAKARGLKRFGYPMGTRQALDMRSNTVVDLEAVGRQLGLETRELRDLWEAYRFMTDRELPRWPALDISLMRFEPGIEERFAALIQAWKTEITELNTTIKERVQRLGESGFLDQSTMQQMSVSYQQAGSWIQQALAFEKDGNAANAYRRFVQSAVMLRFLADSLDVLEPMAQLDIGTVGRKLAVLRNVNGKIEALGKDLGSLVAARTIGGRVNCIMGLSTYVMALSYHNSAEKHIAAVDGIIRTLQARPEAARDARVIGALLYNMGKPFMYLAAADAQLRVTREMLAIGLDQGEQAAFPSLDALADAYISAGNAGFEYFEALVTEENATRLGITREAAAAMIEERELNYPIVRYSILLARNVHRMFQGQKDAVIAMRLGYSAFAYVASATLINKYYSLGAEPQAEGGIRLRRQAELQHQLRLARERTLEAAGRCRAAIGFLPFTVVRYFQIAEALVKEKDDEDKLSALEFYWYAIFAADLAAQLKN